jgi:hypothetical protein
MRDDLVLTIFVLLPVVAAGGMYVFFRRLRLHARRSWRPLWLVLGNALVLCLLASLLLLGGEIDYRFFHDATDSFGLARVTQRWFAQHFHANGSTFRDSIEYRSKAPPGARRVTFLGDSFTAGHGVADVEHRFANLIRRDRPQLEVHVMAQCGWDTGHELALLESKNLDPYQFDLVVLVYCLNDVADIVPEWPRILDRIYRAPSPGFWGENSWLCNTWYYRLLVANDPDVGDYYRFVMSAYAGPLWQQQRQRMTAIRDRVQSRGGRLAVVTFPFLHLLGPAYPYAGVHAQLDAVWRELGVPHLDLLDVFKDCAAADVQVNAYDAHPNERGHAMAAVAIAAWLDFVLAQTGR